MQIVIDIPPKLYKELKIVTVTHAGEVFAQKLIRYIKNGTPLPKGHGRLKDIDWIDNNCDTHYSDKDGSWCYTWRDIDGAPTIIEADKE